MLSKGCCGRLRSGNLGWGRGVVKFEVFLVIFGRGVLTSGASWWSGPGFIGVSMCCQEYVTRKNGVERVQGRGIWDGVKI